jgi:hypothetical protein
MAKTFYEGAFRKIKFFLFFISKQKSDNVNESVKNGFLFIFQTQREGYGNNHMKSNNEK